jgi:hypothetical protein
MFNGVAWMDSGDGSGWRQIAVPEESLSFTDVLGTGETDEASFLICGEVQLAEYYLTADRVWQLDDDDAWTPALVPARAGAPDGGVRRLIDPHTAFSHFDFWTELDGQWQRRGFGLDFQAFAGVRLQDGLLVSGFPEPTLDGNPLGLRVAKFADDWSRVRQVPSHANALIEDFEVFGDVVIGVGDAVYMGPGRVDDYLLF